MTYGYEEQNYVYSVKVCEDLSFGMCTEYILPKQRLMKLYSEEYTDEENNLLKYNSAHIYMKALQNEGV
jgi:hypothetical protein